MFKQHVVCLVLGLSLVQALSGCGGDDGPGPAAVAPLPRPAVPAPPPPPVTGSKLDGRYVGTVKIDGQEYFGDALITVDGAVRLYIGDPYSPTGALQLTRPKSSAQFVGTLSGQVAEATGSGVIIGQQCAVADAARFCNAAASANISVAIVSGDIEGEIQVTTPDGLEVWSLELGSWSNYYRSPAKHGPPAGQYQEELAEFAVDGDVVMNVDEAGQLFLQSAHSGCTANGRLTPHLDGELNVYDVTATIESCSEPFAYLNGEFEGLATTTASSYWNYDLLLRIWLSSPGGSSSQSAVTMLGSPL